MIIPFSDNCVKKFIHLLENFGKCITVPSTLMDLLNHKNWDYIWEQVPGDPERLWLQLINLCLEKESSFFKEDFLKERFEWNLKEGPNVLFNWYKGMIFHSWKQWSYSLFTHELWRLFTLFRLSTFFRPPFSYLLWKFLCFILGLELFHKKEVWIVFKALITL